MCNNTSMSEFDDQKYGEEEISFEAPETISQIYRYRGETEKIADLAQQNIEEYNREVEKPFFVDAEGLTTLDGKPARRASILLKSPGCSKRRGHASAQEYPNCAFCVFSENYSTGGNPVSADQYQKQMENAVETLRPALEPVSELKVDILEIFNSGSFFNESEISSEARERIISIIRENTSKDIVVTVESKIFDLINVEKVDEVLGWLNSDGGSRRLEIAFGLETTDQIIGMQMKKNVSLETLETLISDLAERNVRSFFYVLLKPGLMSEKVAIDTAVESVKQIAAISRQIRLADQLKPHISLGPTRIYQDSLLHAFKSYKAPKYWSIMETIRRLTNENLQQDGKVFDYIGLHVGLSGEGISIVTGGSPKTGSSYCHEKIESILREFNHTMDTTAFLKDYDELLRWDAKNCGCYVEWGEGLRQIPVERINAQDEIMLSEQLKGVLRTEEEAWPEEVRASSEKFVSRARVFPDGFFLGYESGIIVGVSTSEISNFEPSDDIKSWEFITNNGYITPSESDDKISQGHDPKGNSLYVVSLGVRPYYSGRGVGRALIEAQKQLVVARNLKYLFLGSRAPCFAEAKMKNPTLSIDEFVGATDDNGQLLDDDIRFYTRSGLRIAQIKENYMEDDPESMNYGVIMYWENPEYKPN